MKNYEQQIFNPPSWSQENNFPEKKLKEMRIEIKALHRVAEWLKNNGQMESAKKKIMEASRLERSIEHCVANNTLHIPRRVHHG